MKKTLGKILSIVIIVLLVLGEAVLSFFISNGSILFIIGVSALTFIFVWLLLKSLREKEKAKDYKLIIISIAALVFMGICLILMYQSWRELNNLQLQLSYMLTTTIFDSILR